MRRHRSQNQGPATGGGARRDLTQVEHELEVVRGELRRAVVLLESRNAELTAAMEERLGMARDLERLNDSLELRVSERTAEVCRLAAQLRALAAELSQAEQRERRRVAHILHDDVQQLLVAARMQLETAKRGLSNPGGVSSLQNVDTILLEAIHSARQLTLELSPPIVHDAGLSGGLRWLVARFDEKHQFRVSLDVDAQAEPDEEETRLLLYECARELLFNAVKHSGVSGARVRLQRTASGQTLLIVEDSGIGFDPALLARRRADGLSFGLFSIEQRLAHFGGSVTIDSAPGRGVRVTVTTPSGSARGATDSGHAAPAPVRSAVLSGPQGDAIRILLVDDHRMVREGLALLLQLERDLSIVGQAADGPEAVAKADQLLPDVVVMDLNLKGMSGAEATGFIVARHPTVKVIALSMHTDESVARAMLDAGAVAFFSKGVASRELIESIRGHARQRHVSCPG
ncbi:MAG: response regulator [Candidatus Riflebacteria bacterium]|nr:response regulator [Candidatus Riflebacteria bacterium]